MYKIVDDISDKVKYELRMCNMATDLVGFALDTNGNLSVVEKLTSLKSAVLKYIWDTTNGLFYLNDGRLVAHKKGCIRNSCSLFPCPLTECNGLYSIVKGGDR